MSAHGHVVGTAGHVDHGKSTLIRALTGIDPDRLAEEKRRGMTIDLGFAHMTLPSGRLAGIVDVPGHARFIRNMLAGAHGLDAALLVVAADEGVMPQTREHLEILDLLDVRRGVVALTKTDLVDEEWLGMVAEEVREALAGTPLAGSRVVPVAAPSGAGLDELAGALDDLLGSIPARADLGRPRLPVDRVFTISGFGTVVTGTLGGGAIEAGDEMELQPWGRRVRVRGLQQHGRAVRRALPGTRVAANLGGVERDEVGRGDVLAAPGGLAPVRRADARVRVLAGAARPVRHGQRLHLHTGTAEVTARVALLEGDRLEPGAEGWAQLYLGRPAAVAAGDRFVLRLPSPPSTVAGGRFVDVTARRHRPAEAANVVASLARRDAGQAIEEELRKHPRGITRAALLRAAGAPPERLGGLEARAAGDLLFAPEAWQALSAAAAGVLAAHHAAHPMRAGMQRGELLSRLGLGGAGAVLDELARDGAVTVSGQEVALPGHSVRLGPEAEALLGALARAPLAPPPLADAMREAGAGPEVARALARRGDIVRVSDEVAFTREGYEAAVALVRELVGDRGSVTVAHLRDRTGSSRRTVLALLEHLDAQRVTRRVGDERVLR